VSGFAKPDTLDTRFGVFYFFPSLRGAGIFLKLQVVS